jgi:hypothetical protein
MTIMRVYAAGVLRKLATVDPGKLQQVLQEAQSVQAFSNALQPGAQLTPEQQAELYDIVNGLNQIVQSWGGGGGSAGYDSTSPTDAAVWETLQRLAQTCSSVYDGTTQLQHAQTLLSSAADAVIQAANAAISEAGTAQQPAEQTQ